MVELPKTLRPARLDEVPKNSSVVERLKQIRQAKIVEGYTFRLKDRDNEKHKNIPFDFYAEINIDNSRLWNLILALTTMLPDVAALIIGDSDSEPNYGNYIRKSELLKKLEVYKAELIADTFMEWGLIFNDAKSLTEIFVSDSKYLKVWGVDVDSFRKIMADFRLSQIDDLEFIDEYPKVREPLRLVDSSVTDTNKLIDTLKQL